MENESLILPPSYVFQRSSYPVSRLLNLSAALYFALSCSLIYLIVFRCFCRFENLVSTPKTSPDMKKSACCYLVFPSKYHEWRWLLSPLRREKCGLPPERRDKANQG